MAELNINQQAAHEVQEQIERMVELDTLIHFAKGRVSDDHPEAAQLLKMAYTIVSESFDPLERIAEALKAN